MSGVDLTQSLERAVAESDAKELVKQIGTVLARAPEMTDEQCTDAMEKILAEYIVHLRRNAVGSGHG